MDRGTVHQVLTNEKYVGNNIYNRVSFKLKKKRVANPSDMWIRSNAAFEPIIPADLFAQSSKHHPRTQPQIHNDELLDQLRILLKRQGRLSGLLIDEAEGMASSSVYRSRFGSLVQCIQADCLQSSARLPIHRNQSPITSDASHVDSGLDGADSEGGAP